MSIYAICWSRREHKHVTLKARNDEICEIDQQIEFSDYQITGWKVPLVGSAPLILEFSVPETGTVFRKEVCGTVISYNCLGEDRTRCCKEFIRECFSLDQSNPITLEQCVLLDKIVFVKSGSRKLMSAAEHSTLAKAYFGLSTPRTIKDIFEYISDFLGFCKSRSVFNVITQHYVALVMRMMYDNRLFVPFTICRDLMVGKSLEATEELKKILSVKMPLDLQPDMATEIFQENMKMLDEELLYHDYQQGIKLLIGSYQAAFHRTLSKKAKRWNNEMRPSDSFLSEHADLAQEIKNIVNESFKDRRNCYTDGEEILVLFISFVVLFLDKQKASELEGPEDPAEAKRFADFVQKVSIEARTQ